MNPEWGSLVGYWFLVRRPEVWFFAPINYFHSLPTSRLWHLATVDSLAFGWYDLKGNRMGWEYNWINTKQCSVLWNALYIFSYFGRLCIMCSLKWSSFIYTAYEDTASMWYNDFAYLSVLPACKLLTDSDFSSTSSHHLGQWLEQGSYSVNQHFSTIKFWLLLFVLVWIFFLLDWLHLSVIFMMKPFMTYLNNLSFPLHSAQLML